MNDRPTASTITDAQLDQLLLERDAARRMLNADDLRLVDEMTATVEQYMGRAMSAEAELARLRAGEEDGYDPAAYPTPGQWIARFNQATPQERHDAAKWAIDNSQRASDCFLSNHRGQIRQAEAERDGAYRERAQLLALLAALHPSVIAPAPDVDEDGWQILYLRIGGRQASWHIAPRDAELLAHVEHVSADDRRAQWDGHTTEEKYAHIGQHAAQRYADARSRFEILLMDADETLRTTPNNPATSTDEDPDHHDGPLVPGIITEAIRQMDADPYGLKAGMVVQPYREYGKEKWVFRCWGTDDGCEGLVSLDHSSQQGAERARDRHVAEEHQTKEA